MRSRTVSAALWASAILFWRRRTATPPEEPAGRKPVPVRDHERSDADAKGVALAMAGLALFLVLCFFSPMLILRVLASPGRQQHAIEHFVNPPPPTLESNAMLDLARRRRFEIRALEGQDGRHPSIVTAMNVVLQQGIPVRSGPATPAPPRPGADEIQREEAATAGRFQPASNSPEGRQ